MAAMHPARPGFWLGPVTSREQGEAIAKWAGAVFLVFGALQVFLSGLNLIALPAGILYGGAGLLLVRFRSLTWAGAALALALVQIGLVAWSSLSAQMLLGVAPGPRYWIAAAPAFILFLFAWRALRATLALRRPADVMGG